VDTFFQRKKLYPIKKRSQKLKRKYSKEEILDWFFHNYDDPANGVPYNSKEGGYQYYLGGPFDPNDEIQDQFPDIDMDTLNQVLREIYPMGNEWVKRNVY
jgi:hypothetical protein